MEGPQIQPKTSVEKVKDWIKIGTLVGASFFAGKAAIETYNTYERDTEYKNHLEHSMTQEEKDHLVATFSTIEHDFGQEVVSRIKMKDKIAFFNNKERDRDKKVSYQGFDKAGLTNESVEEIIGDGFFFPANWVRGEVDVIYFSDYEWKDKDGVTRGVFMPEKDIMVIFMKSTEYSGNDVDKSKLLFYIKHIGAHELAHANDWENDNESTILQRAELLKKIGERLKSKDKFTSYEAENGSPEYYDSKENLYDKAIEYWAELCKSYFSEPSSLKKKHPIDFDIVNQYIKIQDPNFDVFKTGGPYFDERTGEMLTKWKKFMDPVLTK